MRTLAPQSRRGFTLVEVAVTLIIVGITLLWVLEGMNRAKMTAAQTHNTKLAAELAQQTLAEIESGLYWEDIDEHGLVGNYAEEGYESFSYEVVLGDESFTDVSDEDVGTLPHDSFDERVRRKKEEEDAADGEDEDEEEEETEEVYERVKIKVTFPKATEETPEVILERWIPWIQVYGEEAEADSAAAEGSS